MVHLGTHKERYQCKSCNFKLYKGNTLKHLCISVEKINLMGICKYLKRVDKIPEGLTLSDDLVDDLLIDIL